MSGGSLAGLSPEEIAQVRSYEIAGERTRQQPIQAMIEAQFGLSREDVEAQRIALLRAQEARTTQLLPLEIQERIQRNKTSAAAQAFDEARTKRFIAMSPLEQQRALAEIGGIGARTRASEISAAADAQRIRLAELQGPEELRKVQAEIEYRKAATGDIGKSREQQAEEFKGTHVLTRVPDEDDPRGYVETLVPSTDIVRERSKAAGEAGDKSFQQEHTLRNEARQAAQDKKALEDEATEAEVRATGNPSHPGAQAKIDEFNSKSSRNYLLKLNKGYTYNSVERVPLTDYTGKPLQAKNIMKSWRLYQQTTGEISLDDYLDKFIRRKK